MSGRPRSSPVGSFIFFLCLLLCGAPQADAGTCTDGFLSGDESGIDCGGSCAPCAPRGTTDTSIGYRLLSPTEFAHRSHIVRIPGGTLITPILLDRADTEYILDGNLSAAGTALVLRSGGITVNLNGYSITYHHSGKGQEFGIRADAEVRDVHIVNGSIRQSRYASLTDVALKGSSPIGSRQEDNGAQPYSIKGGLFGGLDIYYRSASTCGISMQWGSGNEVKYCSFTDQGYFLPKPGTVSSFWDRSGNFGAVRFPRAGNVIHHIKVVNARQNGFTVGSGSKVYQNDIRLLGRHTNSVGVMGHAVQDVEIFNNRISGTGAHLFGFMFGGDSKNVRIHRNKVTLQNSPTLVNLWESYHGANGFRTTWGLSNSSVYQNAFEIGVKEVPSSTKRPEGQGLSLGTDVTDTGVEIYDNVVEAKSLDGTARATALAFHAHEGGEIEAHNNLLVSNDSLVAVSTDYGGSKGYPRIRDNILRRLDNAASFRTIVMDEWIASSGQRTARFLSNDFGDGTSFFDVAYPALYMGAVNDIVLEHRVSIIVLASGLPVAGKTVTLIDHAGRLFSSGVTDASGRLDLFIPEVRLTTQSTYDPIRFFMPGFWGTLNRIDLNPYTLSVDSVIQPLMVSEDREILVSLP